MRDSEKLRQESLDDGEIHLEKGDRLALWLSGMLTIGLPCLAMILFIIGVVLLLFGRG